MSRRVASIADRVPGDVVFDIMKKSLSIDWREYVVLVADRLDGNPFAVLVAVILSQNTTDKNSIKAYISLRDSIGVTPERILSASLEELEMAIRPAGLSRQKASAIVEAARTIMRFGGERWLREAPPEEIRSVLLNIRGVGKKTVDVFLSYYRGYGGVFAVDTHAARIARRWGLVGPNASYDDISRALLRYFGPERAEEAHRLLIALGRRYCKAKNPRCDTCPLRDVCPWPDLRVPEELRPRSRERRRGHTKNSGTSQ